VDGSRLILRTERRPRRYVTGGLCLLAAAVVGAWTWVVPWRALGSLPVMAVWLGMGLWRVLGVRQVVLHREVNARVVWSWGLGVPFFQRGAPLAVFERVQLLTASSRSQRDTDCVVRLWGPGIGLRLASTQEENEASDLADAVLRHAALGLQVDEGRVRSFEEASSRTSARFRSWSDERPGGSGSAAALPETTRAPSEPPAGSRMRVHEAGGRLELTVPAPRWPHFVSSLVNGGVMAAVGVLGWGVLATFWRALGAGGRIPLAVIALACSGVGFVVLRRTREAMRTTWCVTVTRQGLEVTWLGSGEFRSTRIAAHLLRDIDVREHPADLERSSRARSTLPMLLLEREDGSQVALGAGLPRWELEWVAARLRHAMAEMFEARRREARGLTRVPESA
jgi:hypothetical protein